LLRGGGGGKIGVGPKAEAEARHVRQKEHLEEAHAFFAVVLFAPSSTLVRQLYLLLKKRRKTKKEVRMMDIPGCKRIEERVG
jgi:hypothetical protein